VRYLGGVFNNYAVVQESTKSFGGHLCTWVPAAAEQLLYAITLLQEKIQAERGSVRKRESVVGGIGFSGEWTALAVNRLI